MITMPRDVHWYEVSFTDADSELLILQEAPMLALILVLMLVAVFLQVFCLLSLSKTDERVPKPVRTRAADKAKEKLTSLGRPIEIVKIN